MFAFHFSQDHVSVSAQTQLTLPELQPWLLNSVSDGQTIISYRSYRRLRYRRTFNEPVRQF